MNYQFECTDSHSTTASSPLRGGQGGVAGELDPETQYYYFGARYYDPEISIWLSVDPLADEYPNLSPYNYCLNNPIRLVDPNGTYATKYEDENGNSLGETRDGNDATVIISDADKDGFLKSFNSTSVLEQHTQENNESWIREYGSAMVSQPGETVTPWALDAISFGSSTDVRNSENVVRSDEGFTLDPTGPALVVLGSKLLNKRGGVGGGGLSGTKTSIASKSLRWMDRVVQNRLGTNYRLPAKSLLARTLGTRGVGAAMGRLVPYIGWGLTAADIGYQLGQEYGPRTWYGKDDNRYFR